jgi:murein hydrolase activator
MIRRAALVLALTGALGAPPVWAQAQSVAEQAAKAAASLQEAVVAMEEATAARDRVSALTRTIQAYEQGLAALRDGLRQARVREATLLLQFDAQRERVSQLLGVLSQMEATPGPLLLLHPSGPLGTARSGMILAEVTPALQAEVTRLQAELTELRDLRVLQEGAGEVLAQGLQTAQAARTTLSQAISERTDLPLRFTEDPEALRGLLESADTLDAFAAGLELEASSAALSIRSFASAEGNLLLPVLGTVLYRAGEADGAGIRRPGMTLATRGRALVTAPWAGTIRYRGPLLDYGNVMILEPGSGYLMVLAGLGTVYGEVGEVVETGAPLGLMGEVTPGSAEFLGNSEDVSGIRETETLYIEIRKGDAPVNPAPWFAATKD